MPLSGGFAGRHGTSSAELPETCSILFVGALKATQAMLIGWVEPGLRQLHKPCRRRRHLLGDM